MVIIFFYGSFNNHGCIYSFFSYDSLLHYGFSSFPSVHFYIMGFFVFSGSLMLNGSLYFSWFVCARWGLLSTLTHLGMMLYLLSSLVHFRILLYVIAVWFTFSFCFMFLTYGSLFEFGVVLYTLVLYGSLSVFVFNFTLWFS